MTSLGMLSTEGSVPIRQTKFAPDGVEFSEDVTGGMWVEEGRRIQTSRRCVPCSHTSFRLTPACFIPPT